MTTPGNRTSDDGRLTERIGTLDPVEFHQALVYSAVHALREGAPIELLDGLTFWTSPTGGTGLVDERAQRREQLRDEKVQATNAYRNARRNANQTDNNRLRADYTTDAESLAHTLDRLEAELAELERLPDTQPTYRAFNSECDYLAHGLAALIRHGEYVPADIPDALAQIIEFSSLRSIAHRGAPEVEAEFYLLLPADGRVARFGPITCRVPNRAYRRTLRDSGDAELARSLLADKLGVDGLAPGHRAVHALTRLLQQEAGWTQLGARILATSGLTVLHQIASHVLWNEPVPDDIDPRLIELVIDTYSNPTFSWNPRGHASDCTLRQLCVDQVVANGGSMPYVDLEAALAGTKVNDLRITIFSREQQLGGAPAWHPCLLRIGDWVQQHPKAGRSLAAVRCPHCNGFASRVVRTPETPACLLCPECRRMPTLDSPVYPEIYLRL